MLPLDVEPDEKPSPSSWLDRLKREARTGIPGAAVSAVLHAAILIALALTVIFREQAPTSEPLDMGWFTNPDGDEGPPMPEPIRLAPVRIDTPSAPTTVAQPTESSQPGARPGHGVVAPVNVGGALGGRPRGGKGGGGAGEGVTDQASRAVDKSLGWLARQQQKDGRWQLHTGYADAGRTRTDTGATALALLAFLGRGHTHQQGDHQAVVQKGLDWLIGIQRPSGDLFDIIEQGRDAHFYAHSQATIVLCEALALTGDERLREPAELAVQFLAAAQNPVKGGWKYRPLDATGIGDLSVTGWALMALHTARMAEIDVPPESYLLASSFLDSVQVSPDDAAFYKYRPDWTAAPNQRWSMTAEGILCRQWLGWERDDPAQQSAVEYLLSEENTPEWKADRRNLYAWYYTAQVLHNRGGDEWKTWYARVQNEIASNQSGDGSWHPTRPRGAALEYADSAGRLYLTALCVLVLETPYRHAAIYEGENDGTRSKKPGGRARQKR
jgi:hypothetical protein